MKTSKEQWQNNKTLEHNTKNKWKKHNEKPVKTLKKNLCVLVAPDRVLMFTRVDTRVPLGPSRARTFGASGSPSYGFLILTAPRGAPPATPKKTLKKPLKNN